MESWQVDYIRDVAPELSTNFEINDWLLTWLRSKGLLSKIDIDTLDAVKLREGEISKKIKLLDILTTRKQAYKIFAEGLHSLKQTKAVEIMSNGYRRQSIRVPDLDTGTKISL